MNRSFRVLVRRLRSPTTCIGIPSLQSYYNAPMTLKEITRYNFHTSTPLWKGKGGKKSKNGGKKGKNMGAAGEGDHEEDFEEEEVEYVPLPDPIDYDKKMNKRLERLEEDFSRIRGGKIGSDMFNHLQVKAHGASMSIVEVAQVTMKGSTKFNVSVFDPELVSATAASIRDSGMGLNPAVEGSNVVVSVNKPSKEAREAIVKGASQVVEKAKNDIRGIRKDIMDKIKKRKEASEDDRKRLVKQMEAITEKHLDKAGKIFRSKERDIMN